MRNISACLSILVAGSVLVSCGSSTPDSSVSGSGGNVSKGGANANGGGGTAASTGTALGGSTAGGASSSGGTTASSTGGSTATTGGSTATVGGGTATTVGGGSSGGAAAGGTTSSNGGTSSKGGATAAGGTSVNVGGAANSGGKSPSGGAANAGGTTSTAGTKATGGLGGTSGSPSTGGSAGVPDVCQTLPVSATGASDAVVGTLITFNDNGGWCWYQDERAVVDAKANKLVIGSVAFGGTRNGNIEAVIYDLTAGTKTSPAKLGNLSVDDHNAPALIVRPDGGYAAMWAGHNENCNTYFSTYSGTSWAAQKTFDWTPQGCPWSRKVTYANMWYLGTELVSFVRSVDTSPSYLTSKDNGASWTYGGRLTSTETVGYVAGYFKYWGNNTDRVDFVGTEAHPRDNDNSLYHGYVAVDKDGVKKVYDSTGKEVDSILADKNAQDITKYTKLFTTGGTVGSVKITNAWNSDLVRYADGTIGLIWTGRVGKVANDEANTDLRLLYGRFDGTSWKLTYLVKAGPKLYADEQDYTGLGALQPDDPNTIYISTPYDPNTDTLKSGAKREIWRGTTCDKGATFKWTAVTANSTKDNYRPIVPKWDATHTALLWMRGTYTTAQSMTMTIVGTITGN